jgi:uncharacterized protein
VLDASVQTALVVIELAQAGRFAEIRDLFAPQLQPVVSAGALQAVWDAELARLGPVASVGAPVREPARARVVVVKVPVTFENGALTLVVSVTDAGQLIGLQLAPAETAEPVAPWEPPMYANPATFHEQENTVGSGSLAVPGTLSVPQASGLLPGVVLLAGSGPHDRDETLGRNKPLKDLAWGLATRGIAVLRFDKVTFSHPSHVNTSPEYTVADEYVPHAIAAIHILQQQPAVDPARVYVLGHSLGGTVDPRVAAAEPTVAGLAILAGGTEPLHWSAVRQIRYLASLDPATAAASEAVVEAMIEQARRVDSPELCPSTPASALPFGIAAPYWLDLRGYKPVEVAATLDIPMVIMQGGRDYQVTVTGDLAAWSGGLAHRPDVTIRVYPSDNHFFFTGTGRSTPAEYEPAQHIDPAVVADIAGWLTTVGLPGSQPENSG